MLWKLQRLAQHKEAAATWCLSAGLQPTQGIALVTHCTMFAGPLHAERHENVGNGVLLVMPLLGVIADPPTCLGPMAPPDAL